MQNVTGNAISIPADMAQKKSYFPIGAVYFSEAGISYKLYSLLMKINLAGKLINRYFTGKVLPYNSIIKLEKGEVFFGLYIKLITNDVNGSYYISFPKNKEEDRDLVYSLIQQCMESGFNSPAAEPLKQSVSEAAVKAKKDYTITTVMGIVLIVVFGLILKNTLLWILDIVLTYMYSHASENKLLRYVTIAAAVIVGILLLR